MKREWGPERGRYVNANTEQLIFKTEIETGRQTEGERQNQIGGGGAGGGRAATAILNSLKYRGQETNEQRVS